MWFINKSGWSVYLVEQTDHYISSSNGKPRHSVIPSNDILQYLLQNLESTSGVEMSSNDAFLII